MNYSDMQIDLILKMLHASNVNKAIDLFLSLLWVSIFKTLSSALILIFRLHLSLVPKNLIAIYKFNYIIIYNWMVIYRIPDPIVASLSVYREWNENAIVSVVYTYIQNMYVFLPI